MEQGSDQAEATVEKLKEEISKETPPVTPTEKKETSVRTETEFRKMQSMKDVADAKAQKLEGENQVLRDQQERQRLMSRQKEIADLEGDTDGQAQARRKHKLEDDMEKLERERVESEGAVQRKYDQSIELATQYNLGLADARELMKAGSPREMELMAQLKVAEMSKGSSPPSPEGGFTPDSGVSDVGGKRSWTAQEVANLSSEDYKKYEREINEALAQGRIKQ